MIGQDLVERSLVLGLDQVVHGSVRQLGEGFVGRRKDRERPLARQRVDEPTGLDRGDERRVVLRVDRVLDDVPGRIHGRPADHRIGDGGGRERQGQSARQSQRDTRSGHWSFLLECAASIAAGGDTELVARTDAARPQMTIRMFAPPSGASSAPIDPPCASATCLEKLRPTPLPPLWVV